MSTEELNRWISQLKRCEYLSETEVRVLCNQAREILVEEANIQRVEAPVTVSMTVVCRGMMSKGSMKKVLVTVNSFLDCTIGLFYRLQVTFMVSFMTS